ncbi:hypothetical protein DPMN_079895 [Dreissena polymorpha]|uniref:Uncharacterized protein n=1 Tax=Dreissena polymorpha TaxID=45954 RepID=A0A9D3YPU8_DREPO|nr:hypothetical protein DPMN_079895 [Dreissena polymorpha]
MLQPHLTSMPGVRTKLNYILVILTGFSIPCTLFSLLRETWLDEGYVWSGLWQICGRNGSCFDLICVSDGIVQTRNLLYAGICTEVLSTLVSLLYVCARKENVVVLSTVLVLSLTYGICTMTAIFKYARDSDSSSFGSAFVWCVVACISGWSMAAVTTLLLCQKRLCSNIPNWCSKRLEHYVLLSQDEV